MKGIDNLKLALGALAGLGNVAAKVLEDKKVNVLDFPALIELYPVFAVAASLKYAELLPELKDLSAEELEALQTHLESSLHFPASLESVEAKIEAALEMIAKVAAWAKAGYELGMEVAALIKK